MSEMIQNPHDESTSDAAAPNKSRLDDSVLEDLSELLRRNETDKSYSALDKSDFTCNNRCDIGQNDRSGFDPDDSIEESKDQRFAADVSDDGINERECMNLPL